MSGVEAIDEAVDADRPAAVHASDDVDDPQRAERIAGFGDRRRLDVRVRKAR